MCCYHTVASADVGVSMCVITTLSHRCCSPWQCIGVTCCGAELCWCAGIVDRDMCCYHTVASADVGISVGVITTLSYRRCSPWQCIGVTCCGAELCWCTCIVDRDFCCCHT